MLDTKKRACLVVVAVVWREHAERETPAVGGGGGDQAGAIEGREGEGLARAQVSS